MVAHYEQLYLKEIVVKSSNNNHIIPVIQQTHNVINTLSLRQNVVST